MSLSATPAPQPAQHKQSQQLKPSNTSSLAHMQLCTRSPQVRIRSARTRGNTGTAARRASPFAEQSGKSNSGMWWAMVATLFDTADPNCPQLNLRTCVAGVGDGGARGCDSRARRSGGMPPSPLSLSYSWSVNEGSDTSSGTCRVPKHHVGRMYNSTLRFDAKYSHCSGV